MTETVPAARSARQRLRDTLRRLDEDVDAWVATAAAQGGEPYMMPLSFLWRDGFLYVSTRASNPVARNLLDTGRVHVALGHTRDVVHIEGVAQALPEEGPEPALRQEFAHRTGFDPAGLGPHYRYFRIRPVRVLAWREVNELAGRELMRDGQWLVTD
ncbi:pyridoxamine 5'-phosphate oxidase family protein [Streptomyces sp. SID5785]|uniref:pyridoxamine 5'-phosphate oxidase family protein n=1 Tax=Streptomyces sp. SID5785 TaxID=2690309 RepID=UPI0013616043|nr:pyridoxamine 5'-phosphate oxidase family protein [Streptomyces sp. SID5785]MZD06309.1 pyridoxamine 5'-phosphate oxidase family protein [Streptomyces sp. SID5785]